MAVPLFQLTPAIKQIASDAIDTLILQLGKPCRLIYPPAQIPCGNCIFDVIGKKSSNRWRTGGPSFFPPNTICPVCNGVGTRATENSETITMLLDFDIKNWLLPGQFGLDTELLLRVPNGMCRSKGFLTDMPKVMRATDAILATNDEAFLRLKYQLVGEPLDTSNIVQGRYFYAYWRRSG